MAFLLPAAPALKEVSISETAKRARQLLRCCQEVPEEATKKVVEVQFSRFNLWASNIGVFAARHASLDYRLRTAPIPKAAVQGTLEILCNYLLSTLLGNPDPTDEEFDAFDGTTEPNLFDFGLKLLQSSFTTIENRRSSLKLVESAISTLHRLSLAIRKASNRNSVVRVPKLFDKDAEYFTLKEFQESVIRVDPIDFEITSGFGDFLRRTLTARWLRSLKDLAADFDQEEKSTSFSVDQNSKDADPKPERNEKASDSGYTDVEFDSDEENENTDYRPDQEDKDTGLESDQKDYRRLLLERVVASISIRRRQLVYFHDHQAKLGMQNLTKAVSEPQKLTGYAAQPLQQPTAMHQLSPLNLQEPGLHQSSSQQVVDVSASETVPSLFESKSFKLSPSTAAASSTTSSSNAGGLRSGGPFEVPPAPEILPGETEKICPYCCLVLPTKTFSARKKSSRWRKHLLEDLQPYICLFKNCDQPGKTYRTFKDWQAHLSQPHDQDWPCPLPHSDAKTAEGETFLFDTSAQFQNHLKFHHFKLDGPNATNIIQTASRPAMLPQWCFVCLAPQNTPLTLMSHLATHLERVFLLALPLRDDIEQSDAVSSGRPTSIASIDAAKSQETPLSGFRGLHVEDSDETSFMAAKDFADGLSTINTEPRFNSWMNEQPSQTHFPEQDDTLEHFAADMKASIEKEAERSNIEAVMEPDMSRHVEYVKNIRFLVDRGHNDLSLVDYHDKNIPRYAILSHTWGADDEEVTFKDIMEGTGKNKAGYKKIEFCKEKALSDGLKYFWVDTCCINKANHTELSEAINSMFRWYRDAQHCYVYLSDLSVGNDSNKSQQTWEPAFRSSRWFTRGWTLQELIAPRSVKFFSQEGEPLGDKKMLKQQIHEITGVPITALSGTALTQFSIEERLRWAARRNTRRKEDKAYCLLGIFNVFMPVIYGEGDYALIRLKEEIDRRSGHWIVTRHANPLFTGREDLLQELDDIVRDATKNVSNRTQCRIVLYGMGGQGKSEICLQLAHRLRQIFWGVFWVDVSTTSTAERSFLDVAQQLSILAQTWDDARLGIANLKQPWLLVLDNADDPTVDYQDYFPDGTLGVVILTSRNNECQQYATVKSIALEGLSDQEAQELLLKVARVSLDQHGVHIEDTTKVASLLRSHPLALIQAGAYISRGHCTLAEYPLVFAQQRQRLLKFRPAQAQSRYRDVYATFEASANILQSSRTESAADALQLLPVLATCGPNRLPLPLFEAGWNGARSISSSGDAGGDDDVVELTQWHVSRLLPLMHADADRWDSFRLIEAVSLLKALSLVSTDTHSGFLSVSMHPLTHVWARDRQTTIEQHDSWVATGCLVAVSRYDRDFWQRHGRQLQPHVHALISWEMSKMFRSQPLVRIAAILVNCGRLLYDMRDDAKVFALMQRLLTHLGLHQQTIDRRWLEVYELTGWNLIKYGKVKEAVSLLEQVVKIQEQTLAKDHPSRLASQHELARAYQANGQVKEAVSLLEQVVKIQEHTLAEDHPDQLASQHELAGAYEANGQVKEAVSLLEQVVKIQEQTLAEDHPSRLASQHELAVMYWGLGHRNAGLQMMKHVVEIRQQVLDGTHPSRIRSEAWLEKFERDVGNTEPL